MKNIVKLCVALCWLTACSTEQPSETTIAEKPQESNLVQLTPAQYKNANIKTVKPEHRTVTSTLQVNGMMEAPPQSMVSVSVPMGGYVKSIKLIPGMHLKKGQLMAELEDQNFIQLQQDYLTAKARLNYQKQEYERQRDLNQSKASSDKVYQQAQTDYKSQQVLLKALAEKLQMVGVNPNRLTENNLTRTMRLFSPFDGYVTKVNVNVGKYVMPSDVLFELVNPRDLHLMLTVFEKDLDKLDLGQQITAYRTNKPEKKYKGKIIYIGKDVGNNRAVDVHCHLEQADPSLVPGMYMNAEIEVQSQLAYTLPEDAVVRYGSKQYVFTVRDSTIFEMVEAKTGTTAQGYTSIVPTASIHPEKQTFVTQGAYTLLMMLKNKEEE